METVQSTLFPHLRSILQFHACGDNTKHTIPCLRRPYIQTHNSMLAEYLTIPRSWRQYKAHNSTLACSWRQYKAHYSALAETTIPRSWRQYKAHYSALAETTYNITIHVTSQCNVFRANLLLHAHNALCIGHPCITRYHNIQISMIFIVLA